MIRIMCYSNQPVVLPRDSEEETANNGNMKNEVEVTSKINHETNNNTQSKN